LAKGQWIHTKLFNSRRRFGIILSPLQAVNLQFIYNIISSIIQNKTYTYLFTVGNRVAKIPGSDSAKSCFWTFFPTINTPTKKKPQHEPPYTVEGFHTKGWTKFFLFRNLLFMIKLMFFKGSERLPQCNFLDKIRICQSVGKN
jgi:hypothetical protein